MIYHVHSFIAGTVVMLHQVVFYIFKQRVHIPVPDRHIINDIFGLFAYKFHLLRLRHRGFVLRIGYLPLIVHRV